MSATPGASALLSALTTEHFTLQSARASTVVESNGRSALFVSSLSGGVVALALVAQLGGVDDTFFVFALSILPALLVLGVLTHARLADLAAQDALYARAIGRIRAYYWALQPDASRYWLLPAGDDLHSAVSSAGTQHMRWHLLSHAATAVDAVTAVLAGALTGLAWTAATQPPPLAATGAALGMAVLTAAVLLHDQNRRWHRVGAAGPVLFSRPRRYEEPDSLTGALAAADRLVRPGQTPTGAGRGVVSRHGAVGLTQDVPVLQWSRRGPTGASRLAAGKQVEQRR